MLINNNISLSPRWGLLGDGTFYQGFAPLPMICHAYGVRSFSRIYHLPLTEDTELTELFIADAINAIRIRFSPTDDTDTMWLLY